MRVGNGLVKHVARGRCCRRTIVSAVRQRDNAVTVLALLINRAGFKFPDRHPSTLRYLPVTGNKFNWRQSLFLPPFFVIIKRYIKHHEKRFRLLFVGLRGSNRGLFPWAPVEGYLVAGEVDRGCFSSRRLCAIRVRWERGSCSSAPSSGRVVWRQRVPRPSRNPSVTMCGLAEMAWISFDTYFLR